LTYRRTRLIYQIVFLALFAFLLVVTAEGSADRYPVKLFLDLSVLSGLATILSQHNLAGGMIFGVLVAAATLFFGRFFCGWICPMGACQHFGSAVFRDQDQKARYAKNTFSRRHQVKYIVLAVFLFSAVFGVILSGWLDPIALITRFSVTVVAPLVNLVAHGGKSQTIAFDAAVLTGGLFVGIFLINAFWPRLWCRVICPLGAILSLFSLRPTFRMVRDESKCVHCGRCRMHCEGACEPDKSFMPSQCLMCMNCVDVCPTRAIEFTRKMPAVATATPSGVELTRREFVFSVVLALGSVGMLRNLKNVLGRGYDQRIRPPGALAEVDFLARCIRCGQCMKVCPTNVLQPARSQTDAEGLWTPVLNMDAGYCEYDCTLCSQVCPTGAIRKITVEEKHQKGFEKIGTASIDRGRCLPWAYGKTCLVCQEVCPVSPKAIYHQPQTLLDANGKKMELAVPYVNAQSCTGCGACQFNCPVQDLPAIRVTSIGEIRSDQRRLML